MVDIEKEEWGKIGKSKNASPAIPVANRPYRGEPEKSNIFFKISNRTTLWDVLS